MIQIISGVTALAVPHHPHAMAYMQSLIGRWRSDDLSGPHPVIDARFSSQNGSTLYETTQMRLRSLHVNKAVIDKPEVPVRGNECSEKMTHFEPASQVHSANVLHRNFHQQPELVSDNAEAAVTEYREVFLHQLEDLEREVTKQNEAAETMKVTMQLAEISRDVDVTRLQRELNLALVSFL